LKILSKEDIIMSLIKNVAPLTGLHTREEFLTRVDEIVETQIAKGESVSIAFIDIDYFLRINQTYGREGGDDVLSQVTFILRENLRKGDLLGRYGGDEFAVLLAPAGAETAMILLEEIRKLVEETEFEIGSGDNKTHIKITLSIGFASIPKDTTKVDELLRKANQALYRAKQNGRNQICMVREEKMVPKSSYYTSSQLEQLSAISKQTRKSESILMREALDLLLQKYHDELEAFDATVILSMEIGNNLLKYVDQNQGSPLLEKIPQIRRRVKEEFGIIFPRIRISDNPGLDPNTYLIKIRGAEVSKGEVIPERLFATGSKEKLGALTGIEAPIPTGEGSGLWILPEHSEMALKKGCLLMDPATFIATHIMETFRMNINNI
jgi:diguanylate cyclase